MFLAKRVIILSITLLIAVQLSEYLHNTGFTARDNALLVIGVLSAQNHSEARDSIRNSWKTLTQRPDIKFYFLIGNDVCPIHPFDRKSELACEALPLENNSGNPLTDFMWTPSIFEKYQDSSRSTILSFTFRVNFPVLFQGIRLWKRSLRGLTSASVHLKDARSGNLITTLSFEDTIHVFKDESEWLEARSDPFLLPKSFDAELQFVFSSNSSKVHIPCYGLSSWFDFGGAIEFTTQFDQDAGWVVFDVDSCTPLSILLELHNVHPYLQERQTRNQQWQNHLFTLSESLAKESSKERDIVFLDVLDVYRNIPNKLLHFYKWADDNIDFSYLLKTDDDTFVDIPVVVQYLETLITTSTKNQPQNLKHMWWWGKLRHGLPVERHGKWQELHYAAPVYPPFPCGGGYILNKNSVKYLVTNSRWLHSFQGEDTSLGIWLSGVHPGFPKNPSCQWSCAGDCVKHSCNRGQLTIQDMLAVWQKYKETLEVC